MRFLLVLLAALAAAPAAAQAPLPPRDPRAVLSFSLDNDALGDGRDRWYTSGLRAMWSSAEDRLPAPLAWLDRGIGRFAGPARSRWSIGLGQSFFTPEDTRLRDPDPTDRPYAGHLFVELGLDRRTASTLDRFALQAGVVGPAALGRGVQSAFHQVIGDREARGWNFQLQDEPVANLHWERTWRFPLGTLPGALETDLLPSVALDAGTVLVAASGGARVRLGRGLMQDFGPARIRPALADTPAPVGEGFGWYVFAGAGGRLVGRDIFLDGNTFRDSRSIDREPGVGEFEAGAAVFWRNVRLSYTGVLRSREFEGQGAAQLFGALSLSVGF